MSKFLEHKNACRAQKRATIGAAANDGMPASRGGAHQRAVRVLNDTKIRNDGRSAVIIRLCTPVKLKHIYSIN